MAGESITRSLGNFDLGASVQTDGGFPGFGSFMPAGRAFQESRDSGRDY